MTGAPPNDGRYDHPAGQGYCLSTTTLVCGESQLQIRSAARPPIGKMLDPHATKRVAAALFAAVGAALVTGLL